MLKLCILKIISDSLANYLKRIGKSSEKWHEGRCIAWEGVTEKTMLVYFTWPAKGPGRHPVSWPWVSHYAYSAVTAAIHTQRLDATLVKWHEDGNIAGWDSWRHLTGASYLLLICAWSCKRSAVTSLLRQNHIIEEEFPKKQV